MTDWTEIDNRLLDWEWYQDDACHAAFKQLRDQDPVHWTEDNRYGKSYWALTRYDDCRDYLLNDLAFSNRWDTHVPSSPQRMTPEERYAIGMDVAIAMIDNPAHDVYRRPLNKHFSVPAIARLKDLIHSSVDEVLAEVAEQPTCEVVSGIALDLPTRIVLRWLGIPPDDWGPIHHWVEGDVRSHEIVAYAEQLARDRMENPRDDFASIVASMEIDGSPMSLHEVTSNIFFLISGALENTQKAISVGVWLLAAHPAQRKLLDDDPTLIKGAIEEILRWSNVSPTRLRIANENIEFGGKLIRAGDWVVGFLASANHDERVFPEPLQFDITRDPNPHLGFGTGIHTCLGRHLARLEMSVLLQKMFGEFDVQFADEPKWGRVHGDAPGRFLASLSISLSPKSVRASAGASR